MAHTDRRTRHFRGSRSHGWGITQKHRGAGSRGGHGMAGSKKHKWSYISKFFPDYFGAKGFKRPWSQVTHDTTINVGFISENIKKLVETGLVKQSGNSYSIDLTQSEFTKLLGTGKVSVKLQVKVAKCSQKAKEKIEAAGGKVESSEADTEETGETGG
jgi:large subunit ribosomal protein L15